MSDKVQPALTAEQWNDRPDTYPLCAEWDGNEHIIAALALFGQPFGFTREMWNAVSALAENYRLECEHDGKGDSEIAEAAQAAADRIEALLPPE